MNQATLVRRVWFVQLRAVFSALVVAWAFGVSVAQADSATSSLSSAARQVALGLGESSPALVAVAPVEFHGLELNEVARASLHEKLRLVVASAVPHAAARVSEPTPPLRGRQLARSAALPLVLLQPSLQRGSLHLSVDRIEWPANFWRRAANPEGTVALHLSISVPIDAEIRRYLPPPRDLLATVETFPSPVGLPIALACGDADGDGGRELMVVGRRAVSFGYFSGESFRPLARSSWSELSPVSASPLRAPLASASIGPDGIWLGSSDRQHTLRLRHAETQQNAVVWPFSVSKYARAYPLGGGACSSFTSAGLSATRRDCTSDRSRVPHNDDAESLAVWRRKVLVDRRGLPRTVTARLPVDSSTLSITVESPVGPLLEYEISAGSQVELVDLTGSGKIEVVSSSPSAAGEPDSLRIHRLEANGPKLLASAASKPITALTVCPFAGRNPPEVVVATEGALRVYR